MPAAAIENGVDPRHGGSLRWAALLLGFSIGGFFDGILLHQILQWHHLLSGLEGAAFGDLRVQVLADGLFHALMYAVGAIGLWLLWRARGRLGEFGAGRRLLGGSLIGFGAWHVIDSVFSHWITGIHRIRMDSANPLAWDLAWFVAFGLVPLAVGWMMRPGGGGGKAVRADVTASFLALAVAAGAPISALPPGDVNGAVVLFRPGTEPAAMMTAVQAVGGRMVWTDRSGELWAIELDDPPQARRLYGRGALLVSTSLLTAGCLRWSRAS